MSKKERAARTSESRAEPGIHAGSGGSRVHVQRREPENPDHVRLDLS
jgi:hypothetical protein